MNDSELDNLKYYLQRTGGLDETQNRYIINEAIRSGADSCRGQLALDNLVHDLWQQGQKDLAAHVERLQLGRLRLWK